MVTAYSPQIRRVAVAGLGLAVVFLTGCVPVGWLPDSSGFIYTTASDFNQLVFYDIARNEKKVLVKDLHATTPWPAVAPDGKRVAVARLAPDMLKVFNLDDMPNVFHLEVIVYDLAGKEVHRSPKLRWGEATGKCTATGLFWSTARDKLIVHDYLEPGMTGIYDFASKTLIRFAGSPSPFGGTPIRPDDKGFLVCRQTEDLTPELVLVDWQGNERAIRLEGKPFETDEQQSLLQSPWYGTSKWDSALAEVTRGRWKISIDTEKRVGKLEEIRRAPGQPDEDAIVQRHDFPGKGARVRVLKPKKKGDILYQLQLFKPGEAKAETLFTLNNGCFVLSPSPNGKWLAIRALGDNCKELDFFLISSEGQVRKISREK